MEQFPLFHTNPNLPFHPSKNAIRFPSVTFMINWSLLIFNKITAGCSFLLFIVFSFPSRYDYVEIHDGNSESADLLGKHCSNIAPAPVISSGPSLHIKFVSDYAHQGAGFSLRYEIFKTGNWMLSAPFFCSNK